LTIKAHLFCHLDRPKEALEIAGHATASDPEDAYAWSARAMALCELTRWAEAEQDARQALSLDPDHPTASNLLAHALRLQNRLDESEGESRRRLARDPESAFSFSTAGWSALQRQQPADAEAHFREALRIDPELDHARNGLREAYKARSGIYRLYLRWVFFMQRMGERNQWVIIVGLYVAYRFGIALLKHVHPLLAVPLIVAYLLFVFGSWLADGLGNLLLLKDRVARLSLTRSEKCDALLVGGLFIGGLFIALLGASPLLPMPVAFMGAALMGAAIPASRICSGSTPTGRLVFAGLAILVAGCAIGAQFHPAPEGSDDLFTSAGSGLLTVSLLGVFGTTWVGLIPSLRARH
jgi:hypothetical protein